MESKPDQVCLGPKLNSSKTDSKGEVETHSLKLQAIDQAAMHYDIGVGMCFLISCRKLLGYVKPSNQQTD